MNNHAYDGNQRKTKQKTEKEPKKSQKNSICISQSRNETKTKPKNQEENFICISLGLRVGNSLKH